MIVFYAEEEEIIFNELCRDVIHFGFSDCGIFAMARNQFLLRAGIFRF